MFWLTDGRRSAYQWDTNIKLVCGAAFDRVDYAQGELVLSVKPYIDGGVTLVNIPNEMLQKSGTITIYGAKFDDPALYTKSRTVMEVRSRPRPADYVYTPTEVETFASLTADVRAMIAQAETAARNANNAARDADNVASEIRGMKERGEFDGKNGDDGVSPIANVRQTANGAIFTVTDKDGTTTAEVHNGAPGKDAKPYDDTEIRKEVGKLKEDIAAKADVPFVAIYNKTTLAEVDEEYAKGRTINVSYPSYYNGEFILNRVDAASYRWVSFNDPMSLYFVTLNRSTGKWSVQGNNAYTKQEINAKVSALEGITSDAYSATKHYSIGEYCISNNVLWRCISECTGVTPAEGVNWTAINANKIGKLKLIKTVHPTDDTGENLDIPLDTVSDEIVILIKTPVTELRKAKYRTFVCLYPDVGGAKWVFGTDSPADNTVDTKQRIVVHNYGDFTESYGCHQRESDYYGSAGNSVENTFVEITSQRITKIRLWCVSGAWASTDTIKIYTR